MTDNYLNEPLNPRWLANSDILLIVRIIDGLSEYPRCLLARKKDLAELAKMRKILMAEYDRRGVSA